MTLPATPLTWIGFLVIMFYAVFPAVALSVAASARQWRTWFTIKSNIIIKVWFGPIAYVTGLFAVQAVYGSGIFLLWNWSAERAIVIMLDPTAPLGFNKIYMYTVLMFFFVKTMAAAIMYGSLFEFQILWTSAVVAALLFLASVAELVLVWLMWWLPGLLLLFPTVYSFYTVIVTFSAAVNSKLDSESKVYVADPVLSLFKTIRKTLTGNASARREPGTSMSSAHKHSKMREY
jgi:hypothetical protein